MNSLHRLERLSAHPKGESLKSPIGGESSWPVDTPGGRFYAEWDTEVPTSREGQLIFFFQFLQAGGRWEQFMKECPLTYTGNRGSGALNVMGTVLLSVLCGPRSRTRCVVIVRESPGRGAGGTTGTPSRRDPLDLPLADGPSLA